MEVVAAALDFTPDWFRQVEVAAAALKLSPDCRCRRRLSSPPTGCRLVEVAVALKLAAARQNPLELNAAALDFKPLEVVDGVCWIWS